MKNILRNIAVGAGLISACMAQAQNLNSAYFLDGYAYGHELNPAKDYERNAYVAIPLLGNINMEKTGNLAFTDVFMLNNSGKLSLFMHPDFTLEQALEGISANNKFNVDMRLDLLGAGFHAWGGFNTINITSRTNVGFKAPYSLFEAAKELGNKDYDISGVGTTATSWVEIGFGHSRQFGQAVRLGAKVKILLGAGRANLNVENARLNLESPDKWIVTANAEADVSLKGFTWGEMETKEYKDPTRGTYEQINFSNVDVKNPSVSGGGLAFDLGGEWDLGKQGWVKGLKVSASLLDLGFIAWTETHRAYNKGEDFVFEGFKDIQIEDGPGTPMKEQTHSFADRLSDLYSLQAGETGKSTSMLGATFNVGVEYEMPFYDKMSVGLLSTTRIQGGYSWNEERFSCTVSPLKWLEGSVNFGIGSFGPSFGWVANIHPKGFNIFVGMDHTMGKFTKQGIPMGKNTGFTLGINIPFGKKI